MRCRSTQTKNRLYSDVSKKNNSISEEAEVYTYGTFFLLESPPSLGKPAKKAAMSLPGLPSEGVVAGVSTLIVPLRKAHSERSFRLISVK